MPPIISTIEIACPPEEVFAYATDPARFAEWQHDVASVRIHGDRPPGLGTRFTTTRQIGRVGYETTQEITDFSPPRSFAAQSVGGPLRANATITVEPLAGGGRSRVTFGLDFQGQGVGRLLMPDVVRRIATKGAPRSYQNLKERLERGNQQASDSAGSTGRTAG
jgi:uncharacterized protein YndB with AHSA1/START domain